MKFHENCLLPKWRAGCAPDSWYFGCHLMWYMVGCLYTERPLGGTMLSRTFLAVWRQRKTNCIGSYVKSSEVGLPFGTHQCFLNLFVWILCQRVCYLMRKPSVTISHRTCFCTRRVGNQDWTCERSPANIEAVTRLSTICNSAYGMLHYMPVKAIARLYEVRNIHSLKDSQIEFCRRFFYVNVSVLFPICAVFP